MLPSTWPSRYKSSLPESSPLMNTDLPICAKPTAGALIEYSSWCERAALKKLGTTKWCNGIRTGLLRNEPPWQTSAEAAHCNDYTQGIECAASLVSGYERTRFPRQRFSISWYTNSSGAFVREDKQAGKILGIAGAVAWVALFAGIGARCLLAATPQASPPNSSGAIELVRSAVANEVAAANDASIKHLFRSRKQTLQGLQTRLYVETREAMAGMTIAYNDQPLTPEQMQGEENRLAGLLRDPEQTRQTVFLPLHLFWRQRLVVVSDGHAGHRLPRFHIESGL